MINFTIEDQARVEVSVDSILATTFPEMKHGRGFDRDAVRDFVEQIAAVVGSLQVQLQATEAQVQRLQKEVDEGSRTSEVLQAVSIISSAQRTSDSIIAEANSYSARVMSEAHAAYDDARRRGAEAERQAEDRVRLLALSSKVHQDELDKQTAYLRTLRDATRTQMEKFLEGMLSHLAEEYGRAHPIAAQAAEADRTDTGAQELPEGGIASIESITASQPQDLDGKTGSTNGFASVGSGH